jgi:hypothetical protein
MYERLLISPAATAIILSQGISRTSASVDMFSACGRSNFLLWLSALVLSRTCEKMCFVSSENGHVSRCYGMMLWQSRRRPIPDEMTSLRQSVLSLARRARAHWPSHSSDSGGRGTLQCPMLLSSCTTQAAPHGELRYRSRLGDRRRAAVDCKPFGRGLFVALATPSDFRVMKMMNSSPLTQFAGRKPSANPHEVIRLTSDLKAVCFSLLGTDLKFEDCHQA